MPRWLTPWPLPLTTGPQFLEGTQLTQLTQLTQEQPRVRRFQHRKDEAFLDFFIWYFLFKKTGEIIFYIYIFSGIKENLLSIFLLRSLVLLYKLIMRCCFLQVQTPSLWTITCKYNIWIINFYNNTLLSNYSRIFFKTNELGDNYNFHNQTLISKHSRQFWEDISNSLLYVI